MFDPWPWIIIFPWGTEELHTKASLGPPHVYIRPCPRVYDGIASLGGSISLRDQDSSVICYPAWAAEQGLGESGPLFFKDAPRYKVTSLVSCIFRFVVAECVILKILLSRFSFQPCCAIMHLHASFRLSMMTWWRIYLWQINQRSVCYEEARDDRVRSKTLKWYAVPTTYYLHWRLATRV